MEPTITLLESIWSSVAELGTQLDDADWDRPTDCPGWTVRDQYAHMIGTESMLAGRPQPDVEVPDAPHLRNDIGRANEAWIVAHRDMSGPEVLDAFRSITAERLAALRAMSEAEWDAPGFTPEGPGPYRSFMEIRAFDCWLHDQDIREAVDRPGDLTGAAADHALDRMRAPMGYVVGKKVGAPQGVTVRFTVAGDPLIDFAIGVEGRANLLAEMPAEVTTALGFDRRSFSRLAAGCKDAEWGLGEGGVTIDGDAELGRTILDNMGYTI